VVLNPVEYLGTASVAKLIAAIATYPHEVVRTRVREQRGKVSETSKKKILGCFLSVFKGKYTGFMQTLRVIAAEEGIKGLYGGMGAHLLRVVPNAAIMFFTYETVVKFLS
jgi:solute carrier family 25 protein 33/36